MPKYTWLSDVSDNELRGLLSSFGEHEGKIFTAATKEWWRRKAIKISKWPVAKITLVGVDKPVEAVCFCRRAVPWITPCDGKGPNDPKHRPRRLLPPVKAWRPYSAEDKANLAWEQLRQTVLECSCGEINNRDTPVWRLFGTQVWWPKVKTRQNQIEIRTCPAARTADDLAHGLRWSEAGFNSVQCYWCICGRPGYETKKAKRFPAF